MDSKAGSQSTEQLHYKSSGSDNRITLILSILAVLIAVIGVVIAAVGLARSGESNVVINGMNPGGMAGSNQGNAASLKDDDRVWLISAGHAGIAEEYLDEATGQLKGYHVDMVNAVCRIAGKNCEIVEDIWTNCWDSGEPAKGGTGLMARYYDACTAYSQTYERRRTFKFTAPLGARVNDVAFAVKTGNPGGFDHLDVSGKIIGFGDGWAADDNCLKRDPNVGGTLAAANIRHYTSQQDLVAAVIDGSVDAAYSYISLFTGVEGIEVYDEHVANCELAGRAMMTRKDNSMWQWWDPAMEALLKSPEYQLICNDINVQHGHLPGPGTEVCITT